MVYLLKDGGLREVAISQVIDQLGTFGSLSVGLDCLGCRNVDCIRLPDLFLFLDRLLL